MAKLYPGGFVVARSLDQRWYAVARADNQGTIDYIVRSRGGLNGSPLRRPTAPSCAIAVRQVAELAASAFPSSQRHLQPVPDGHPIGAILLEEGFVGEVTAPDRLTAYTLTQCGLVQYDL